MSFRIGDAIFTGAGKPAAVIGRTEDGTNLRIETQGERINEIKRRGYINGLSPEEREQYNNIVDSVREHPETADRVNELRTKVDELRRDPRQLNVVRYLEAELAHTMNTTGYVPREYEVSEIHNR